MNLVLLKEKDFIDKNCVRIEKRRFKHLILINKVKKNDKLICGILNGKLGIGRVKKISDSFIDMDIVLDIDPPKPLDLILVLALPRPKMLKRIIENTTSLGVKKIYLINSWRVEKSFWQSSLLENDNLYKYMEAGLELSKDTIMPKIYKKRFFTKFVNEELYDISKNTLRLTADPKAYKRCPLNINKPVTLIVGPEGGFISIEIQTLEKQGFNTYNLGSRILKVETAVTYLISRLYS